MGNGGQEGGLGIVKGTKPLVLFLKKDLLLIVFFQMKIENNAADNTYRDKCQEYICQPVFSVAKGVTLSGKWYATRHSPIYRTISRRETIRARHFSSISTVKIMANTKNAGMPP